MKPIHRWTFLGIASVSLAAILAVAGQSVWGQLNEKGNGPLPPPPLIINGLPDLPGPSPKPEKAGAPEDPVHRLPDVKPGAPPVPAFPDTVPLPLPLPPSEVVQVGNPPLPPVTTATPPAPQLLPKTLGSNGPVVQTLSPESPPLSAVGEVTPGRQQPSVSLEWVAPQTVRIHQALPWQLIVRNTSAAAVQNVTVRQRLPQGVLCKASEPQAINEAGELVWHVGTLTPDQSRRIDLQLVCQVRGAMNCQASVTFTGTAVHQVQVREPQLIVKMRTADKVIAGEPVTLLFAVNNPGDGLEEGVKVKAVLPDGLEYSRGKVVEVEVGNLNPKEIRAMQLVCTAKGSGVQKCFVESTADGGLTSSDSVQVDILTPKLEAAMSGPKLRYLDRHAVYVMKVANPGSAPATNVEVQNVLPAGLKFHKATEGGQYQATTRTVLWALGDLQPGQSKEIAIDVVPVEPGDHRVLAQVKTSGGLKTEAEARTRVEGLSSLLIELADTDDPIEVGAETAYELRVSNSGTKTETNLEVVCTLPEQLEFRGAKVSTALRYRLEGREVIFEPLPKLAPRADVIYRIQVKGIAAGDVRFRTRIRADDLHEPIVREERTRIYSDDVPMRAPAAPNPTVVPAPTPPVLPLPALPGGK